ncbi:MAG: penicillin-insensitive murein endopeptidase [Succinivibrionaceae bacterium]|nr:penicillin-insensitive murein endopeptidase [Succinivibrionaceae bacterium]
MTFTRLSSAVLLCLGCMTAPALADSLYGDPMARSVQIARADPVSASSDVRVLDDRKPAAPARRVTYADRSAPAKSFSSEPVGSYSNGCLVNGIQANPDSEFFQLYHPQNQRHYGDISLIRFLERYSKKVHQKAGVESVLVGDMSSRYGGPFNKGHASHQIGLDVDIEFAHRRLPKSKLTTRGNAVVLVDRGAQVVNSNFSRKYYDMIMIAAQDPEVERIFVSPAIKVAMCDMTRDESLQPYLRKVRPWYGHTEHFHVRLKCPAGAADCQKQEKPEPMHSIAEEKKEALSWFEPKKEIKVPSAAQIAGALIAPAKPKAKGFPEHCGLYYQGLNLKVPEPKKGRRR